MAPTAPTRSATVLTVSDGVSTGTRQDAGGEAVAARLREAGYAPVTREVVPDEAGRIATAIRTAAGASDLVVTTGGTGVAVRDVTPEATAAVVDRTIPGIAEAMRAAGRSSTPLADLSRGIVGHVGGALVANLPGSPRGALENLEVLLGVAAHVHDLLAGATGHGAADDTRPTAAPAGAPAGRGGADDVLDRLRAARRDGRDVVLATAVAVEGQPPCGVGTQLLLDADGTVLAGTLGCSDFDAAARADAAGVVAGREPATRTYHHEDGTVDVLLAPHVAAPRLLLLGATAVARHVAVFARAVGHEVVVVPADGEHVPDELAAAADAVEAASDVVVRPGTVLVHTDHDDPSLVDRLRSLLDAGVDHVELMGSRRHVAAHLAALRDAGIDTGRVHTPAGLDIGGRSAAEIALSIVAGLVARRHGRPGGHLA